MEPASLTDKLEPWRGSARDVAGDAAVEVQAAGELEIAVDVAALPIRVSMRGDLESRLNMALALRFKRRRRSREMTARPARRPSCSSGLRSSRCSGLKPGGIAISWSMFSKYPKIEG